LLVIVLSLGSLSTVSATYSARQTYLIEFGGTIDGKLIQDAGGTIKYKFSTIPVIAAELTEEQVLAIVNNPNVLYAEEDYEVTATIEETPWGISDVKAPEVHQMGIEGKGVRVGVMDTGIDREHEDLSITGGVSFVKGVADYDDDNGHGTHAAGIIAALNNNIGVIGTAPEANLYAIKVLNSSGTGYYSDIIAGIEWAVNNQMDIVSMSFGSLNQSKAP